MAFAFEKLDIYRKSLDFVSDIRAYCKEKRTDYDMLDQLKRAALSVALNVAEGSGRWHKGEKQHFYYIARGSLFECIPILQILLAENLIQQNQYNEFYGKARESGQDVDEVDSIDKLVIPGSGFDRRGIASYLIRKIKPAVLIPDKRTTTNNSRCFYIDIGRGSNTLGIEDDSILNFRLGVYLKRDLLKALGGIAISILIGNAFNYFGLREYLHLYFPFIIPFTILVTIIGLIWMFRKRRKMLDRMPKSTIEYLDHDGVN